ncbi:MAG: OB-fold nucleic acid binding domain-containing protein [Candidatus Aenigmarchaeota archaeon]|nr:OB-fold nucleic acid binding domain-containing protein [Candidatus Aenigmarchaeota archaeon]
MEEKHENSEKPVAAPTANSDTKEGVSRAAENTTNPQFKRIPIQRCRVCDVLSASPASDGNGNFFESPLSDRLSRVHLFGIVREVFASEDNKYAFITIDDTTGIIRCKAFGNTEVVTDIKAGHMVDVIGRIREYNDEVYIMPEIVRVQSDPNIETLRWVEILNVLKEKGIDTKAAAPSVSPVKVKETAVTEKHDASSEQPAPTEKVQKKDEPSDSSDARAKILEIIRTENKGDGADYPSIVSLSGFESGAVDTVLSELLSEGTCYEPRPGKIKVL